MGFDNECILNIQSLAGEYFCPVCRLLVYPNEALQSQCTHLYCKPCLTYVVSTTRACPYDGYLVTEAYSKPLIESNKSLADTIGKIAVHCLYHRSGCTWQGPLNDCTSHCSGCAFGDSPVVCNRCGIQIVHRQVQEHAQNCPGVQPQAQKPEGATDTSASSTGAAANQDQAVVVTSQSLTSQTTTTAAPSQDPNVKTNSSSQVQSVVQGAELTAEQWYQQQQQYQQYYQQYPGFDPYQQHYQQYYPQQQAAIAQYQQPHLQAHVPPTTGQHQHQVYMQPQAQSQSQLQPQQQAQLQPQQQAQLQPQQQNLVQINPQQQQQHPTVPPHSELQSQTYPPAHGNPYPQPQTQPHGQSISQFHTQQAQVPQYQQSHPQIQQSQPQIHPQIQTQSQHLFQSQSLAQVQPQGQLQHHTQVSSPQVNQALNANVQVQAQNPPAHAVSGHQSYTQPQPQQVQTGTSQQFPAYVPPQAMHLAQSHNPVQLQAQFAQQSVLTRPPSQSALPSQQQPALLPSLGSVQNVASTQQPIHPHSQQPGHFVNQRPVMQQVQQVVPQQYYQQPLAAPSQLRPQGQSHSFIQHPYPQQLQNVTQLHGSHIGQSQNVVGRHLMPNHGVQSLPYAQPSTGVQVRSVYPGANQQNILATNDQGKLHPEQFFGDKIFHKGLVQQMAEVSSEKVAKATNVVAHGSEVKSVKSETDMKSLGNEHKSSVEYKSKKPESHLFENIEPKLKPFAKKDQELENSIVKEEVVVGSQPKSSSQEVEFLEEQARELQKGAIGISAGGPVAASAASTSHQRGSHLVTTSDQGRQQPLPSHYGPSVLPQPPGAPPFAPHQLQGLGYPPTHFKPLGVPGQPLHPPEHGQPPGGVSDLGSAESFGRESYNQGHAGTPSHGPPPQGAAGSHGGVMPLYGPEGQKSSQHSTNGLEAETYSNQRLNYTDSRQSDPNNMSVNGTLGFVSVSARESRDERFKPLPDEHAFRHVLDHQFPSRGQFEDDLKQFPRLPSPDADHVLKFRDPSSRPFDKGHHGSKYDNGLKSDSVMGSIPSKFLSPYHGDASLRSNDAWERPVGLREGTRRMESIHGHPDFFGPGPAFGRHHMDALAPRSPARALPGIPSRGFGGSDLDNINGRDMRRFGEPLVNSFHEGRFLEGRGGRPMGEHFRNDLIGQDNLPSNIRRVEHLGPSNMQWHLHMGEPAGFGAHPHHVRRGEMASPRMFEPFGGGNMSSHPRFGEPGFRSSFSLHGFPISDGSYTAEMEFSNLRKRKAMSNGWCRICKVDCDTIEGLDLHSQTIEHQKKAMDMVRSIKQNAKKHKLTSGEHSSPRDTSKLKSTRSEGGGKKN